MKKNLFFILVSLISSLAINAQGVSKLFGLVGGYPQANQSSNGYLFSTDSSGLNFQVKYDFPVTTFGANPQNVELAAYNGKLYGTTYLGGVNNAGTIFEYDPTNNAYLKKYDFAFTQGGSPRGSLLLYNGKFYGLASQYGANGNGCIFEWDPTTNIYTKKFDFTGNGGAYPGRGAQNSLRLLNGKMYGTTQQGGVNGLGVVFEWDPATNIYRDLYDGINATGFEFYNNVTFYNNKIYCMSHQGAATNGGALYVIDPTLPNGSNTTVLKDFDNASGRNPNNNEMIVYNNKLYGCLNQNGANGSGTLFELDPATNVFTKLVDFNYTPTGRGPLAKLVVNGTKFLGFCNEGGINGRGVIYEWDPASPTTVVKKYDFGVDNNDNPINPGNATFTLFNLKFYATTYNGGFTNLGTIIEYDYAANTLTKKKDFNAAENGRIPYGRPVLLNGKVYGTCSTGPQEPGSSGCIWEFNPSTSIYSRKFLFDFANNSANGSGPSSSPIAYNGKLYGTTGAGGNIGRGVFYAFDPVTTAYTKYDIYPMGGDNPIGEPTLYNNKMYGMTRDNGTANNGIIYSFDPATNILAKLYDVQNAGSIKPSAGFAVYNNKLYGATSSGGPNNSGGIILFDPVANTATTVAGFSGAIGVSVNNAFTLYNNKFYGIASGGGANGRGAILQFDPATNSLTNVYSFTTAGSIGYDPQGELTVSGNKLYCLTQGAGGGITNVVQFDPVSTTVSLQSSYTASSNFNNLVTHNGLTVVPAFIANGIPNSCENYPVVNINATNNNQWVPILNTAGDVVAEIKANGNNLGNISASTYINNGTVREDPMKQLYMDRNITITVQTQPATNVDIRLYIKTSEFIALKNAVNSQSQASGVNTINDVAIFKNQLPCSSAITLNASRLTTTPSFYEYGYVLSANIPSFSTFYFAKNTFEVLPVTLINFDAVKENNEVKLSWQTENEINFGNFEIERSGTSGGFIKINTVLAKGNYEKANYTINDIQPFNGINYYRLKLIDKDGRFSYSNIVKIDFSKKYSVSILPNPAKDYIIINGAAAFKQIQIIDITGKIVMKMNKEFTNRYNITDLCKGVYFVRLIGREDKIAGKIIVE
jgi:uncharacterized repeat protein (TIGR03803 family)